MLCEIRLRFRDGWFRPDQRVDLLPRLSGSFPRARFGNHLAGGDRGSVAQTGPPLGVRQVGGGCRRPHARNGRKIRDHASALGKFG